MASNLVLTGGERRYLEHVRRAQSRGMVLSEYCRAVGLNPYALYSMRRQMRRKGKLPPAAAAVRGKERTGGGVPRRFVAVRVTETAVAAESTGGSGMVCRLRHESGWVLECAGWPPAAWLRELAREASHAGA
jgi:hypothetical protein